MPSSTSKSSYPGWSVYTSPGPTYVPPVPRASTLSWAARSVRDRAVLAIAFRGSSATARLSINHFVRSDSIVFLKQTVHPPCLMAPEIQQGGKSLITFQSMKFLLIENGSYSNPDGAFFSRCSRRLRNGSERGGSGGPLSVLVRCGGCSGTDGEAV